MAVYLFHFERPYHHAQHYLGCSFDLEDRLKSHYGGYGSKLLRAVLLAGISFRVVRVWPYGDFALEKSLKSLKNNPKLCPICNPSLVVPFECPDWSDIQPIAF